jgi:hypothetical protein
LFKNIKNNDKMNDKQKINLLKEEFESEIKTLNTLLGTITRRRDIITNLILELDSDVESNIIEETIVDGTQPIKKLSRHF